MWRTSAPFDLTLRSIKRSKSKYILRLIYRKGHELGHRLPLNSNSESYRKSKCVIRFKFEWPSMIKFQITYIPNPYISERSRIAAYITIEH